MTRKILGALALVAILCGHSRAQSAGAVTGGSAPMSFGVAIATQAVGAAGAAVTATCPANTVVMFGSCNCTGTTVGLTTIIFSGPSGTWTAGVGTTFTAWTCQSAAVTTGQTCAALVQCGIIRN